MKILQICSRIPYPPHDGGAIATLAVTQNLTRKGHFVHVLAINTPKHFQKDNILDPYASKLTSVFVDTSISPFKAMRNLFKTIPYNIERFISGDFNQKLIEILQESTFDIIQVEGTFVAWYIDTIRKYCKTPVILRAHNLEFRIWERLFQNEKNIFKKWYYGTLAKGVYKFEMEYLKKFDLIAAISPVDAEDLQKYDKKLQIKIIQAGTDLPEKTTTVGDENIYSLFILSSFNWRPNQEALKWFIANVWNDLLKNIPQLKLHLAGKSMPDEIRNLQAPNMINHGFIENAMEFMNTYNIMIVPLLSGGGMRVKIIEAMALGKCVVSTAIGAEGIEVKDNHNIVLADSPQEMIDKISQLFSDLRRVKEIGQNAREFVHQNFSNQIMIAKFLDAYQELIKKSDNLN